MSDDDIATQELEAIKNLNKLAAEMGWENTHKDYKQRLALIQQAFLTKFKQAAGREPSSKMHKDGSEAKTRQQMVWGEKGGFFTKKVTNATSWNDKVLWNIIKKEIHEGIWSADRAAPGNNEWRRFKLKTHTSYYYVRLTAKEQGYLIEEGKPKGSFEQEEEEEEADEADEGLPDMVPDEEPPPPPDPPPKRQGKASLKATEAAAASSSNEGASKRKRGR